MLNLKKNLGISRSYISSQYLFIFLSNPLNLLRAIARVTLRLILGDRRLKSSVYQCLLKWHKLPYTFSDILRQKRLIHDTNWKLLIILDACRYDYFKQECGLKGKLIPVITEGSCTIEWAKKTFIGKYDDMIYISGNPFISNHRFQNWIATDHFYMVENVWDYGFKEINGMQTIPPEEIYETTKKMLGFYPQKRFIVHFLQPHTPYIGEVKLPPTKDDQNCSLTEKRQKDAEVIGKMIFPEWTRVKSWLLKDKKIVKDSYKSNLKLALKFVRKLIGEVEGNVVITSDHGDFITSDHGDGHPCGINLPELVIVPWFEVDRTRHVQKHVKFASRDMVEKGIKKRTTKEEEERVKQRLKALGYL